MQSKEKATIYTFAGFKLIPAENLLLAGDKKLSLRPKAFSLLLYLVENAGNLCEKQKLLNALWGETNVEEGNLNRTIFEIRKILGDDKGEPKFIETIPRVGYRFNAVVKISGFESPVNEPVRENKPPSNRPRWKTIAYSLGIVLLISVAGAAFWKFQTLKRPVLTKFGEWQLTFGPPDENTPFWTTDGKIRFASHTKEKPWNWMRINADGTEMIAEGVRISPDGKKAISYDDNDPGISYISNADGSDKRRLPFAIGNMDWSRVSNEIVAQFYPDGKHEASDIVIIDLDTLAYKNITNSPTFDADPSFSPDAQQVLLTSTRDGNAEIYVMNRDGSNVRRLTNSPAWESFAAFSPDGTQISYNSDREKEKNNVYLMNFDGSGKETALPRGDYGNYTGNENWSPDGTKLVYSSDRDGGENLFVIDAELNKPVSFLSEAGKNLKYPRISKDGLRMVYLAGTGPDSFEIRVFEMTTKKSETIHGLKNETDLSLSPDGKTVAFHEKLGDNTEICLIDLDGANFRNVSNNPARDVDPVFSPDGGRLAFLSNRGKSQGVLNVYVMNTDGSAERLVYSGGNAGTNVSLDWSADGRELYLANDREDGRNGNFEIFRIPADGGEPVRLTNRPHSADDGPVVSPDGKKIAFQSLQKGNSEIYVMNADGTGLLRLTRNLADDRNANWSADGTKIYFSSNRGGEFSIYELTF